MLDYDLILHAAALLKGRVRRTELIHADYFRDRLKLPLYFKCENLQHTGSFKIRGALNFMLSQPPEALERGVVTASAGNHAQGVALSAQLLGVKATIYMPETTPPQKVFSTRDYGAEVLLCGRNFDEACSAAYQGASDRGALFVHAFDDELIMAGQGTVGLEILEQLPEVANLLVPVGGGGLISGIASAMKKARPQLRIVGVEAEAAPSMHLSLKKGEIVTVPLHPSLADGIAIKTAGKKTFPIVRELVDEVVVVGEEEIAQAIVSLLERAKLMVEGAGAVGVAALLNGKVKRLEGPTVVVLSGGNIDVKTIATVVERGLVAAGRFLKLKVQLEDLPGALAHLTAEVAKTRANISIITHDRRARSLPIGKTEVLLELETRGVEHIQQVIKHLSDHNYEVEVTR